MRKIFRVRPQPDGVASCDARLHQAIFGLEERFPHLSARCVITVAQAVALTLAAMGLVLALALNAAGTVFAATGLLSALFVAGTLFRMMLAFAGDKPVAAAPPPVPEDLPTYSILVPMYREAPVLPALVAALEAMAYPRHLLDIALVLEEDDGETIDAARRLNLPAPFRLVLVPPGGPRTKPKAANYALAQARGELLVVYDAEDRPEPDQLLKAAALFRAGPRRIACLQARLNFYNAHRNWLTRMFALDYALWFDLLLPGLERIGAPIPLGGTSNHFRTDVLRAIGGWDAFNVTEDADIGIRLAQLGHGVTMLDSTTYEEAPASFGPWLRQRSRWLKGHAQTWLVHMRNPVAFAQRTGFVGFAAFQLFLGGGVLSALVSPLLWVALLAGLLLHDPGHGMSLAAMPGGSLMLNNLALIYLAMIGPRRRGWHDLSPYGLTVMAYWAMVSAAGYRGIWQLARRPFYWEKTPHGGSHG